MPNHKREKGIPEHVEWIPEDYLNVTSTNPTGRNDLHTAKTIEFAQEQARLGAPMPFPDQDDETAPGETDEEDEEEDVQPAHDDPQNPHDGDLPPPNALSVLPEGDDEDLPPPPNAELATE